MKRNIFIFFVVCFTLIYLTESCSSQKKISDLRRGEVPSVALKLGRDDGFLPQLNRTTLTSRDTIKILEDDGSEILIMKAIKDEETGEMVATDVIDAAVVTTNFRNVAERMGKVDIAFQVVVPETMMDSKWQLRFYPDMYVLEDSIRLDPVIITGSGYRKAQERGYQQYEKFLSRIINDLLVMR